MPAVCAENVRDELIRSLYRDESQYDVLLRETDEAAVRRAACAEMHTLLSRALDIVHEVTRCRRCPVAWASADAAPRTPTHRCETFTSLCVRFKCVHIYNV